MGTQAYWMRHPWRFVEEDGGAPTYAATLADVLEDAPEGAVVWRRTGRKDRGGDYAYVPVGSVMGGRLVRFE